MMLRFSSSEALQRWRRGLPAGTRTALVPTMGALHQGHLSLVQRARQQADLVVMSVFVNPLQFRPGEDFERYPRDLERDATMAAEAGVDGFFCPPVQDMYPAHREILITAGATATRWEGAARPGHFDGVLTVVAKLLHLAYPHFAVFGQKDIQQVTLIRKLIQELNFPVDLIVAPILRDNDGLALSSRNAYLSPQERQAAPAVNQGLQAARRLWLEGEHRASVLQDVVRSHLTRSPLILPEYIAVTESEQLLSVSEALPGTILAVAVKLGATRLIDNVILEEEKVLRCVAD